LDSDSNDGFGQFGAYQQQPQQQQMATNFQQVSPTFPQQASYQELNNVSTNAEQMSNPILHQTHFQQQSQFSAVKQENRFVQVL
jgi:hypothetical protein